MSLKIIITFVILTLLSVYAAFLNHHPVEINLTQTTSIHPPMVIVILGSVLLGILAGIIYGWTQDVAETWKRFREGVKRNQQKEQAHELESLYERGENAYAAGSLDKALPIFEQILQKYPNHDGALYYKGAILNQKGERGRALEIHQQAVQAAPDNVRALNSLAEHYAALGMASKELEVLQKIRSVSGDSRDTLEKIRDLYQKKNDWINAAGIQKQLIGLGNNENERARERERMSHLTFGLGMDLLDKKDVGGAMGEMRKAIKTNGRCMPAYVALGDMYLKQEKKKEAGQTWKAGFSATHSPIFLLRLQTISETPEDLEKIVKLYKESIVASMNSQRENLVMLLGILYLAKGNAEQAQETLKSVQPQNSLIHSALLVETQQKIQDAKGMEETSGFLFKQARDSLIETIQMNSRKALGDWAVENQAWDPVFKQSPYAI